MNKSTLFFLLFILPFYVFAQKPFNLSFNHLGREQGLSNTNVFHIFKDSKGFVWLSTPNGLNKFDGIKCKAYKPLNSGLQGVDIKEVVEDLNGDLWIGSEKGLHFYDYKTDKISYVSLFGKNADKFTHPYTVDHKGILWLVYENGTENHGLYTYNPKTKQLNFIYKADNLLFSKRQNNEHHTAVRSIIVSDISKNGFKILDFESYKIVKIRSFFDGKNNLPKIGIDANYIYYKSDSTIWFSHLGKGLLKFDIKANTYAYINQFDGNNILAFNNITPYKHYLFIGSILGIFIFDTQTHKIVQQYKHLSYEPLGLNATYNEEIHIDKEGNLFTSQLGVGVDFCNLNKSIIEQGLSKELTMSLFNIDDNQVYNILNRDDEVWAKLHRGPVMVFDKDRNYKDKFAGQNLILNDEKKRVWLYDAKKFTLIDEKFNKKTIDFPNLPSPNGQGWKVVMSQGNDNQYFQVIDGDVFELNEKANLKFETQAIEPINIEDHVILKPIYFDKDSQKLFVVLDWWSKFYICQKINNKWEIISKPQLNCQIFCVKKALHTPHKLWLGTNIGLILFDTQNYSYQLISEKQGLPDNLIEDIIPEPNGDYWLVSNKGISHFDFKSNKYTEYNNTDGANSVGYNTNCAFLNSNGDAVFSGTNGLNIITQKFIKDFALKPLTFIKEIKANDKAISNLGNINTLSKIDLEYGQNSIELNIIGLQYAHPQKVTIKYFLENQDTEWAEIENNGKIRYSNLSPGTYLLKYQAKDADLLSEVKTLKITIAAPFYKTNWFRLICMVFLLGLGYMFYKIRSQQIKRKTEQVEEIKRIKAESEVQALRSQMNPHFIFNSMGTIDYYILNNDTKNASRFLGKFSQLIRLILNQSRHEFTSIKDEIKMLNLYIGLESEKNDEVFEYILDIDPKLQEGNYQLPTMIIQPFVENAIIHGLRNVKGRKGTLTIKMILESDSLEVFIEDDGIGRKNAEELNKTKIINHKSLGLDIIKSRLQKLELEYPQKVKLEITDAKNPLKSGTCVHITLPIISLKT